MPLIKNSEHAWYFRSYAVAVMEGKRFENRTVRSRLALVEGIYLILSFEGWKKHSLALIPDIVDFKARNNIPDALDLQDPLVVHVKRPF